MIKSGKIYSPQRFLEAATGKKYLLSYTEPIVPQIERILIKHRKPHSSYPLTEAQKALNTKGNIVLVGCCDISKDFKAVEQYRWFKVSKDFKAA